jgi:hypothetical protein
MKESIGRQASVVHAMVNRPSDGVDPPPIRPDRQSILATEMALSVLAYNMTRVMNIVEIKPLVAAIAA